MIHTERSCFSWDSATKCIDERYTNTRTKVFLIKDHNLKGTSVDEFLKPYAAHNIVIIPTSINEHYIRVCVIDDDCNEVHIAVDDHTKKFKHYTWSKMVKTTDDWCPSYENDMVEGKVFITPPPYSKNIAVRFCYWGNDDLGMEKDHYFPDTKEGYKEALKKYKEFKEQLNNATVITFDALKADGFFSA
jgi:hypothetical protein